MKVKSESEVAQSCPTFHKPMDCSLPGSSAHGIFQARVLEWGTIAFSEKKKKDKLPDPKIQLWNNQRRNTTDIPVLKGEQKEENHSM